MSTYLLSAVGVIFLSVIVSLLVPEGKLNKSITFIMRLICIFVLVQPVTGIFKISESSSDIGVDYEYISSVYSNHQSKQLEKVLAEKFKVNTDCTVSVVYEDGNFSQVATSVCLAEENVEIFDSIYEYLLESGYINITVYAEST